MSIVTQTTPQIKTSEVWPMVSSRISSGSPFSSGSAAWQCSEKLAALDGDVFLSLSYTTVDQLLRIRATNRMEFLGSIQIAKRLGHGQYETIIGQSEFDQWLSEVTGQQQECLLDLALAEFNERSQWSGSDTITVWKNGTKQAWLSRDKNGFICLQLFKDAAKLTDRKYSRPLAIGFYSPADKMWVESPSVRDDYSRWIQESKRALL